MKKLVLFLAITGCASTAQPVITPEPTAPVTREELDKYNRDIGQAIGAIVEYIAGLQSRGMLPKPGE